MGGVSPLGAHIAALSRYRLVVFLEQAAKRSVAIVKRMQDKVWVIGVLCVVFRSQTDVINPQIITCSWKCIEAWKFNIQVIY